MTPHARAQTLRRVRRAILWLGLLGLLLPVSLAWTAAVGGQVELRAKNRAGVPCTRSRGARTISGAFRTAQKPRS
jgi:hypothetical protein